MNYFEEATLRLKQQLKVTEDKQAAAALELSEAAWKMRKKRGNFPEKELWALSAQRPDLKLDVGYVLNGAVGSHAAQVKSLVEILDRILTVENLNTVQADEKYSLLPGTLAKALSFQLPAAPQDETLLDLTAPGRERR